MGCHARRRGECQCRRPIASIGKFRTQFAGCRRKLTAKVSTRVITGRADVSMRNFVELWNLDRPDHRSICEARRLLRLLGSVCQLDAAGLCRCRSVAKPARMVGDQYVPEVGLFTRSWHPWSITCSRRNWRLHMCLSTVMIQPSTRCLCKVALILLQG